MDGKKRRVFSTIFNHYFAAKKGQVTIFIIIGIVILFVFAGVLYFTKISVKTPIKAEEGPIVAMVPSEFQPIQAYTENCLRNTLKQGLKLLGQQGGHIYPELKGKFTSRPADADGILLGATPVPYWYYRVNLNGEMLNTYSSLQPKLHLSEDPALSVEAQLNRFVGEKINNCLQEYQPFVGQGFTISVDDDKEKISTSIGDTSVSALLELPVRAARGSAEKELTQFYVKIPLALKHYFAVAEQIIKAEQDARFLEKQGMELLSIYSRKDARYLAPISLDGYELVSSVVWSEANLKQRYAELLTSYVPLLQFLGSANFYYNPVSSILTQKAIDNSVLTLTGAEDVDVNFNFIPSEIYFKTNSQNGVIAPSSALVHANILTFGFQEFDTHYDISYPVLVTLRDALVLDGEDFLFNFALEANIRNNEPAPAGKPSVERASVSLSPLACNPQQRETGLLKTIVVDSYTKEPLDAVRIGFSIPDYAECDVGLTDKQGQLEEKYPAVYGGVVSYLKKDYLTNFYPIDTYKLKDKTALIGYAVADVPAPKAVEMDRIKKIKVNVVKKNVEKCLTPLLCEYTEGLSAFILPYTDITCNRGEQQCFFPAGESLFGAGKPIAQLEAQGSLSRYNEYYLTKTTVLLAEDEEVMLNLERVKGLRPEILSEPFFASAMIKGVEKTSSETAPAELNLVPGVYKVSLQVIKKSKVNIPEDERCFAYDIISVTLRECSKLTPSALDSYVAGGLEWNNSETYLTITPEMLYTSQAITFTVPVQDIDAIPEKITAPQKECGGYVCVGGVCLFQACEEKDVEIAGKVMEDVQAPGKITEKTSTAQYRALLKPTFQ